MITYVYGDLFQSPAKVLVNPVNTVGVMGGGLAHDFKRFYPAMFEQYRDLCEQDAFDIGQLMLYRTPHKWVLNFPTKKHFRANSKADYIKAGLKKFVSHYADMNITSASFPRLGAGLGNLDWEEEVRPLMEAYLNPLPISIYVHLYDPDEDDPFTAERRNVRAIRAWLESQPQHVDFDRFWRYLSRFIGEMHEFKRLDTGEPFTALLDKPGRRGRRRNLILRTDDPKPIFIAESALNDLWSYIQRAGYVLPQNLPGGLEAYADYLLSMLSELDFLTPVYLATVNSERVIGLHYVPPVEKDPDMQVLSFKAEGEEV